MARYGKIGDFDPEKEDWDLYVERLAYYFAANDIKDKEKQKAILLSVIGADSYKLLRNLVVPATPADKSLDELVEVMKEHQNPTPSAIVQRYKFNSRNQMPKEGVADFVAELRQIAKHCDYQDKLDEMLRDRLVSGLRNERIQRRLLAEPDLTFKKAKDIAVGMETAEKNSHLLADQTKVTNNGTVNQLRKGKHPTKTQETKECFRCGGKHTASTCKFKDATCYKCSKKGHITRVCRSKVSKGNDTKPKEQWPRQKFKRDGGTNLLQEGNMEEEYAMFKISDNKAKPLQVEMSINGQKTTMEVDTGAALTVASHETWKKLKGTSQAQLKPTTVSLKTYTGESVPVRGEAIVKVNYENTEYELPIVVVEGSTHTLLGRNWLRAIKLNWHEIFTVNIDSRKSNLAKKFPEVFQDGLGTLKGAKAKIHVDPDAKPSYWKARPVPYLLKEKIEVELERLVEAGILEPVQYSEWAAPIVPVVKENGNVRICGDYKMTINKVSKLDNYPIPKTEDLFATLNGGQQFTKLDMSQAYQQLMLDEESKGYTTINTHKGLFRYTRLPFGVSSAPGIYQRVMDNLLQGIPYVVVRVDDILVSGEDTAAHMRNLEEVLSRLATAGLRLNEEKCTFLADKVVYLGQMVTREGVQPVKEKVKAVTEAPEPENVSQLKSYLGMLNYYHRYLPNLAAELHPLHMLLRKGTPWNWKQEQAEAFQRSKELLTKANLLVHFDSSKEIVLACDASPYGIGAVLAHRMVDGSERPIAYASRTLAPAEKNYSQVEKEGLSVVFGVRKFHQYLYGTRFTVYTDHKPLLGLFDENKPIPTMAAERIRRWALTLSAYEYTIQYKPGKNHGNADALSRLPLKKSVEVPKLGNTILLLDHLETTPVTAEKISEWTRRDPLMARVLEYIAQGWPPVLQGHEEELRPYFSRRMELTVEAGCLMWGQRVVIPPQGRTSMLKELHMGHPGICRMKALARSVMWWPKMDAELEHQVKTCTPCQENRQKPAQAPLHPWEFPRRPWTRLHIDFAGPFLGKMWLVIVDTYSKWIGVHMMSTSTSCATVEKLQETFAIHGLPEIVVSDNGSNFTSSEFREFMERNGIKHVRTAPYHPSSNGAAERGVQTVKEGLKKQERGTLQTKLSRVLFQYRITPQTTTGQSPAELLMGRKLKSRLDLIKPDTGRRVRRKQEDQKSQHDVHTQKRSFKIGEPVYVTNYGRGEKWLQGTIESQTGPVSHVIRLTDNKLVKRHQDQMRRRYCPTKPVILSWEPDSAMDPVPTATPTLADTTPPSATVVTPSTPKAPEEPKSNPSDEASKQSEERRYPSRDRKTPAHLKDFTT